MNIIQAENLVRTFRNGIIEQTVLKGIDFRVKEGEFVSIVGRSGAGKSTLLYQLSLLDTPTKGTVVLDGIDTSKFNENEKSALRLKELGYVFQDYALLQELTALENVVIPLLMQGLDRVAAYKKAQKALERVGLAERLENTPSRLSGGEQQRVSIARAVAHDPKIIFADEPTANLDSETSRTVMQVFLDLHREGQTIIIVTHEPEYAAFTERIVTLSDGQVIKDEKTEESEYIRIKN